MSIKDTEDATFERLTVVVTCYNKIEFIKPIFASLRRLIQMGAEVVIIDDGSVDGSSELLREIYEKEKGNFTLEKISNLGLAGARDRGIEVATREYIFCLDIDDQPNIPVLAEFFQSFLMSGAEIGQANFTFTENGNLGKVTIESDKDISFNTADHRSELFDSRSWWRFIYSRKFLLQKENRFNKVFLPLKGKSFVLDDIFWMLHLSGTDNKIFQSDINTSIYNYYLPSFNEADRWDSFLRQILMIPTATQLYFHSLVEHSCKHDLTWMSKTMFKLLWDHASLLSHRNYIFSAIDFAKAGTDLAKNLSIKYSILNLVLVALTPLRILKRQLFLKSH